jgi:hypothetical protein
MYANTDVHIVDISGRNSPSGQDGYYLALDSVTKQASCQASECPAWVADRGRHHWFRRWAIGVLRTLRLVHIVVETLFAPSSDPPKELQAQYFRFLLSLALQPIGLFCEYVSFTYSRIFRSYV